MAVEVEQEQEFRIAVDGKEYSLDDLTFREQRELRKTVRELVDDPQADIDEAAMMDVLPAVALVLKRRDDPKYSIDQALELKVADLTAKANGNGKRPTKRATT